MDLPEEIYIAHTHGRQSEPNLTGTLHKEILCLFPSIREYKHVIPDIIFHEPGNNDKNLFALEVKRAKNRSRQERTKDIETLCGLVFGGILQYQYGCALEIDEETAFAVWFCHDKQVPLALKSIFRKGKAPLNTVLYKNDVRTYHLITEEREEATYAFHFVRSYDPTRVVVKSSKPLCQILGANSANWAIDKIEGRTATCHPVFEMERIEKHPEKRRTCMLMVTHQCNLNCVYCYEKFKDAAEMDLETAKRAILTEAQYVRDHADTFEELEIDFMGGEPLMNMRLIKQVVEWLETENPLQGLPYICFATTNGTLVHEHRDWLKAHKHTFCLGLSYDGASRQNANRGTAAQSIPLEFCHRLWPFQGLHATISKESIHTFGDDIIDLHKKHPDYHLSVALAQGVDWTEEDAKTYARQLKKLSDYYLNPRRKNTLQFINLLTRDLSAFVQRDTAEPQRKYCGSGSGMITYDVDGHTYGCHMFTPIIMGEARARLLRDCATQCADMPLEDPACATCLLKNYCPTCLGFNYQFRGDPRIRDKRQCQMYLAEVRESCTFQLRYFIAHAPQRDEEASRLRGAIAAGKMLQHLSAEATPPFHTNPN